jgi:hypothetical protein
LNVGDKFDLTERRVKVEEGDSVTHTDCVAFDTEAEAEAKAGALGLTPGSYFIVRFKAAAQS